MLGFGVVGVCIGCLFGWFRLVGFWAFLLVLLLCCCWCVWYWFLGLVMQWLLACLWLFLSGLVVGWLDFAAVPGLGDLLLCCLVSGT